MVPVAAEVKEVFCSLSLKMEPRISVLEFPVALGPAYAGK